MRDLRLPTNPFYVSDEEKQSVLKENTITYVKHSRIFEGMLNVIKKAESPYIFLGVTEPFVRNNILVGDSVVCQVLTEGHEYMVSGKISDIDISRNGLVKVEVNEVFKFVNIRKAKRYLVNLSCNMCDSQGRNLYAVIKNISASGIALVCNEKVEKGFLVSVKFAADADKNDFIMFKSKIMRAVPSVGYIEYGMEIEEIDEKNRAALDAFLFQLENDEKFIFNLLK